MNVLVVLGHPDPDSLNAALALACVQALKADGHEVVFHDLCAEGFDPALPATEALRGAELPDEIGRHCAELAAAEGIVVVHPNWWGKPPAVLAGWVDRVFRPGLAYEFVEGDGGEGVPVGLLRADRAVVLNTANTEQGREQAVFGDPLERFWRDCVFGLCGVGDVRRRTFGIVCTSTEAERKGWLGEAAAMVREAFGAESA